MKSLAPRGCVICGVSLVLSKFGQQKLYCSDTCNKKAQYRRNTEKLKERVGAWRQKSGYGDKLYEQLIKIRDDAKGGPCVDCNGKFDPVCMDFDHRPGETKLGCVSAMFARRRVSLEVIMEEIKKCDLVCSNCHRLRTKARRVKK